tara:strand:+ start:1744 stop:4431 length:2688 start_codon:yes stop_codon:yes gene_type:complete
MTRKSLTIVLFSFIYHSTIFSQFKYRELLFIPWGDQSDQVILRENISGRFGPTSFNVNDDNIFILDFNKKQLKQYVNGRNLTNNAIDNPLHDIFYINESGAPVFNKLQNYVRDKAVEVIIKNKNTLTVKGPGLNIILEDSSTIGFGQYLGKVASGHHYLYIENIIQQVPLLIKRKIFVVDETGVVKIIFEYPNNNYTYIPQEFFINQGNLFFMASRENGVTIGGWFNNNEISDSLVIYTLPDSLLGGDHYNFDVPYISEPENIKNHDERDESLIYPPVTPGEALEMAAAYVSYSWVAQDQNIVGAATTDPQGVMIQTPEWVQMGDNYHVPYKWGGFNTLDEFYSGLLENKFAGDRITDCSQNYCVSNYCIGVDCSGFVSRCWNLSTHYSTAMMDNDITIAYDSWDDIKPGDAIHKVGHVRMVVLKNDDGSILTVEASGYDWKVSYRNYNLSQLTAYTPRYYQGMEGSATSSPIPRLSSVINRDEIILNWNLESPDEISGFNLYGHSSSEGWSLVNSIDPDISTFSLSHQGVPIYFNLTSILSSDENSEGLKSDSYGVYESNQSKNILIVDGFDRTSGSYPFPYHSFGMRMGQSLAPWGYSFDTVDNDELLFGNVLLGDYEAIFWLLGDESTADETFSSFEQDLVTDYLTQGGKIFVSGSEIAWDLDHSGNASDKTFINDFLKTKYDLDDASSYEVVGHPQGPFSGLTLHYDNGNYGVYEENYPDAFLCVGGSSPALNYGNELIAATHFTGTVSNSQDIAQVFLLGFPFETIYDESERIELVGMVLDYFGFDLQPDQEDEQTYPDKFTIYDNYPNPFNPLTTISYFIPEDSRVKIEIFDMMGRKVKNLVNNSQKSGQQSVKWNATNNFGNPVSTGVYFYKIQSGRVVKTNKMCYIK